MWRRVWSRSLWVRLTAAFALVILIGSLAVVLLVNTITSHEFALYVTRDSARWARWLAPQLAAYYADNGSWAGVERLIIGRGGMPMMMGWGMNMDEMMRMHRSMMGNMPPGMRQDMWTGMGLQVLLMDANGTVIVDSTHQHVGELLPEDVLAQATPIRVGGQEVGAVLVAPLYSTSAPESIFLQAVTRAVLIVGLGMGVVALTVAAFISRQITAPLRRLTAAAYQVARGNLTVRVPVHGEDDLARVSMAFNRMALSLAQQQRLRRQLMADIAHELRTPLSVIQAQVEAILDGVFPPSVENVQPIHEQALLLRRLVDDLRDLSLAEAGDLELAREPVDLGTLTGKVTRDVQASAQEKGVLVQVEGGDEDLTVLGDAQRLEQVLLNLLSNAVRHTPPGGEVTVRVWGERNQVFCQVRDTGPGIRPEDIPHVFERFWRADRSRSRHTGGTGLGLAIARKWVEAHDGRIWVESPPGEGAIFTFALPRADLAQVDSDQDELRNEGLSNGLSSQDTPDHARTGRH